MQSLPSLLADTLWQAFQIQGGQGRIRDRKCTQEKVQLTASDDNLWDTVFLPNGRLQHRSTRFKGLRLDTPWLVPENNLLLASCSGFHG